MKARLQKKGKRSLLKASVTKISNKKLNKLAKHGKLRQAKGREKKKLLGLVQDRLNHKNRHLPEVEDNTPPEEDIPLEEADYEYYAKPGRDFNFLSESSIAEKQPRKRKREKEGEVEEGYEKVPRQSLGPNKQTRALLPIKSKEKGIIPREHEEEEEEEEPENEEVEEKKEEEEPEADEPAEPLPELSTTELYFQRQTLLAERKQSIATLANSVTEQPEDAMKQLKELRGFLDEEDPGVAIIVRKLAMVSLLEVFKDIIPGYRIRVSTDKEKTNVMKKETKSIKDFEDLLINNYRHYLEYLEASAKGQTASGKSRKKQRRGVKEYKLPQEAIQAAQQISLRCLGELLVTHPHFNFRTNIITVLVPFVVDKSSELSDMACGYIKRIFRTDRSGEVSLEIARLIGRIVKARHFSVHPKVLNTFLALKIKEINKGGPSENNKAARRAKFRQLSRKDKKRHKQMHLLEKELEDESSESVRARKLRVHTEVINMVFLTYFRILKNARQSVLLAAVLEGLAKFALLINLTFFDDLFAVLNDLVSSEELTYRESLHCVQTAFTILSGQGTALNIDPINFYTHLYKTLFHLHAGHSGEDMPIAISCLDIMISKRRKQMSEQRMLSFIKRLTSLALQLEAGGAISSLAVARTFMQAHTRSDLLLDTDYLGSGEFRPELEDPEHCNAHNTSVYELHLLKKHYNPCVRQYADHILGGAPSQGRKALPAEIGRKSASELYEAFDAKNDFNPPVPAKTNKKKKKQQPRVDFVQKEFNDMGHMVDISEEDMSNLSVCLTHRKQDRSSRSKPRVSSKKPRHSHTAS